MIDINTLWNDTKVKLSAVLQAISFEVWIEKLEPICFIGHTIVLQTGSQSSKNTVVKRYRDTILEAIKEINPIIQDVKIIVESEKAECLKNQDYTLGDELVVKKSDKPQNLGPTFNKKYTFSNFVVGKSNEIAVAAAQAVADNPGERFNPLFIWGGVGLGKTHLLHAIGNYINEKYPHKKIMYISTETYVNDFVEAIKDVKTSNQFREKYRSVDILMIDDIQFLAGRTGSQEALFHTFNDLYQNDKHIIISSDRPPKDISPLEERLRTRFQWGLLTDIQTPDLETRIAILKKKADAANFYLSDEVASFIASNIESNIRDMEGLLNKVMFYSQLSGQKVTSVAVAQEALKDYIGKKSNDSFDEHDILTTTCKYFNVPENEVIGKKRNKEFVDPRMVAIYLISELLSTPLVKIGEIFGGRDHATIIHSRDKITEELKTNNKLKIQINDIKDMLYKR